MLVWPSVLSLLRPLTIHLFFETLGLPFLFPTSPFQDLRPYTFRWSHKIKCSSIKLCFDCSASPLVPNGCFTPEFHTKGFSQQHQPKLLQNKLKSRVQWSNNKQDVIGHYATQGFVESLHEMPLCYFSFWASVHICWNQIVWRWDSEWA